MSGAYAGIWELISARPLVPAQVALARKLVGSMLDTGVPQRKWNLDDGSSIHVLLVNGIPKVTFTQGETANEQRPDVTDLWLPRGFVLYPAWQAAPFGYGLPIIPDPAGGAYDAVNLAPGLNTARWTAGGPCGEVLVSRDLDAGYPVDRRAIAVPLLYHPSRGPVFRWTGQGSYDQREANAAWNAYRMELAAPVANYSDEDVAAALSLFEQINAYRAGTGVTKLALLPRGYYRPAKVMASIMLANGSTDETSTAYPATYQTSADRLTKDGYSATVMEVAFDTFDRGDHPTAFELRHLGGGAVDVLTAWQGEPADDAVLKKDVGVAAFGDVGNRGGYWAADVIERTRWIEAGNVSWQSADAGLPPISWHGFASINLAWETFPAVYDMAHESTLPILPVRTFTDDGGDCWLNYPRSTSATPADLEPAMSRHIYCRGRAIAMAPRGGLVWGACVAQSSPQKVTMDRLIAVVHHPEDQPADYVHEGFTRYLRVWWCDIPRRAHLRLVPQKTVCGEDSIDPWGWKGGHLVDLGSMPDPSSGFVASPGPNSLKYASAWRFAGDGRRAICLRDYGTQADYSISVIGNRSWLASSHARAVELVFDIQEDDVAVSVVFHDYTAGQVGTPELLANGKPPLSGDTLTDVNGDPAALYDGGAYPIAVDYDAGGFVTYALSVDVFTTAAIALEAGFNAPLVYHYVGVGSAASDRLAKLSRAVLAGCSFKTPTQNFESTLVNVADVRSGAFFSHGMLPRYEAPTSGLPIDLSVAPSTPTGAPCDTFSMAGVAGCRMFIDGAMANERWFPSPDGALWYPVPRCHQTGESAWTWLPMAASSNVQCYYAERFGQFVFSYQCAPMPRATLVIDAAPDSTACGCSLTTDALAAAHFMDEAYLAPRGGAALASIPLPEHDWLIYSKVV